VVEDGVTIRRIALGALYLALLTGLAACDVGSVPTPGATGAPAQSAGQIPPTPLPASTDPAAPPPPTEPPAIARVNGEPIPLTQYQNEVARYEAALIAQGLDPNTAEGQARLEQARQDVLAGMIDTLLIEQEARRKGVSVSDAQLDAEIQAMIDISGGSDAFAAQLAANGETLEEVRERQRVALLTGVIRDQVIADVSNVGPQVHARHILLDDANLANSLLAQLQAGADFASLARQYSQDTLTRDTGGDLGWFPRGFLISKEVEDAAFALQTGQISGVVQSAFGFHIVQVIEVDPARPVPAEQLVDLQRAYFERWMDSLRSSANIER
jgi:parvulin-like peptidyl-prolyl isomerase